MPKAYITFRASLDLKRALIEAARKERRTLSQYVLMAVEQWLNLFKSKKRSE